MTTHDHQTLADLIDRIAETAEAGEGVTVDTIQKIAGERFAGPLLFFPAMVVVSPLSLVPTLPSIVAITVILVASQVLAGRRSIWLPKRVRAATLSPERTLQAVGFMRPAARWIGKVTKPRLTFLIDGIGDRLAAAICILVAITMPPLEFFPGASTSAGVIISAFGLAITTRDGVLLSLCFGLVAAVAYAAWRIFT